MVHLNIKFAEYQIYLSILLKCPEKFIAIKAVWPQPQPSRQLEVKFKIYTFVAHSGLEMGLNFLKSNARNLYRV